MELNLSIKELIYYVNSESYGVAFNDIKKDSDIKYKLALSLYFVDVSIQLIKFECIET